MAKRHYHDSDLAGDVDLVVDQAHLTACAATPWDPMCVFVHDRNGDDHIDAQDVGMFAQCTGTTQDPCTPRSPAPFFDPNGDEELEAFDWLAFHTCFGTTSGLCKFVTDIDRDASIDLDDYAEFQRAYGGPSIPRALGSVTSGASRFGNPFAWTGQRYDAGVQLYHFVFRGYSPQLGRWLQRDPIGPKDAINLYLYAKSRPTGLIDPLGLFSLIPDSWLQGMVDWWGAGEFLDSTGGRENTYLNLASDRAPHRTRSER
jgi:RHS repeat-associated protein